MFLKNYLLCISIMNKDICISIILGIIISLLFKYYYISPTVVIENSIDEQN